MLLQPQIICDRTCDALIVFNHEYSHFEDWTFGDNAPIFLIFSLTISGLETCSVDAVAMLREAHVTFSGTELPHKSLKTFGPTTIVSPHPEDATLACGGLIALLHRNNQPVSIVVVSDGGSVRKIEALTAAQELGVAPAGVQFLDYRAGEIPSELVSGFPVVVKRVHAVLETLKPSTLLVPFRGDAHADHTAVWHMFRTAVRRMKHAPRILEYSMTAGPLTEKLVSEHQPEVWKLDVASVLARKQRALLMHSQTGEDHSIDLRSYEGFFEFRD